MEYLLFLIISVVGIDYYTKFQQKIGSNTFATKDIPDLDNDFEMKIHIDLMAWFALIRLFLESVYIYFNINEHDSKNTSL